MTKKTGVWLFVFLLLVTGAVFLWFYLSKEPNPAKKEFQSPVVVVKVPEVSLDNTIEAIGTTKAFESVTITANVTEYVRKLHFEDGDSVQKGDLLVELATEEELAQLAEASARLKEAEQQFNRVKNLVQRNFLARSEFDTRQANVASIKAQIQRIQTMISDRTIRAPFDGVLGFRNISDGTLVEPGDEIAVLNMVQPLRLDLTIPERYLSEVYKNMPFTASSIAFSDKIFEGTITTISPRVNEQTRSLKLRGRLDNKDNLLKPGMLIHVHIKIGATKALKIPEEAVLASGKERYVFIITSDKTAEKKPIEILQRQGTSVYCKADFAPETQVVSEGAFRLSPGLTVRIEHASE